MTARQRGGLVCWPDASATVPSVICVTLSAAGLRRSPLAGAIVEVAGRVVRWPEICLQAAEERVKA